ncbi:hypothetical protein ABI59_23480 [Acidobacteria bacterium Mor1]|nr:hypothetical protein ABI59_23480 [Acidobacteria bacterium Mor1]
MHKTSNYLFVLLALSVAVSAAAQVPGEVTGLQIDGSGTLTWDVTVDADDYNVYRGSLAGLAAGQPLRCHGDEIVGTSFLSAENPAPGQAFGYLVTGEGAGGEGTPGNSQGSERYMGGLCDPVMSHHMQLRLGYGLDEWTESRMAALGLDAYLAEQLDPASIDESTNTTLNDLLAVLEPPDSHVEYFQSRIVRSVFARRQFEEQVTAFFDNHFNTDFFEVFGYFLGIYPPCNDQGQPPWCDPDYPNEAIRVGAMQQFNDSFAYRDMAFNGNFRDMVEQMSLGPAMMIYLDTIVSTGGNPNENFPRELLELYMMGVDNGYTQTDVEELSRVFTGWRVCQKALANLDDPLAPCQAFYWIETGDWTANFDPTLHDCTAKTLFSGTPHETLIPDTCDGLGQPTAAGVDDVYLALDAIFDHPSTAEFISTKLLQRFVSENPTQPMIDAVVAVWNDGGNPAGIGDVRAVLTEIMAQGLLNPDLAGSKIKTPWEHVSSALRATRGNTDGISVLLDYMTRMGHLPGFNDVPTGFAEDGAAWIGTNNMLERQNYGRILGFYDPVSLPEFNSDVMGLLSDNGISTAPGNAEAIVNFFIDRFFAGSVTEAERQLAVDFLNTDPDGVPSDYDEARIREVVGLLLGYPHFMEQ